LVCLTYTKVQARTLADICNDLAAGPLAELERCYLLAPDQGSIAAGRSGFEVVMGGLVGLDIGLRPVRRFAGRRLHIAAGTGRRHHG